MTELTPCQEAAVCSLTEYVQAYFARKAGTPKAAILCGPIGTGKTLVLSKVMDLVDADCVRSTASDVRNQRTLREFLAKVTNQENVAAATTMSGTRQCVIVIEDIETLSIMDKGGLSEVIACINPLRGKRTATKKDKLIIDNTWTVPIICVCQEEDKRTVELKKDSFCVAVESPSSTTLKRIAERNLQKASVELRQDQIDCLVDFADHDIRKLILLCLEASHTKNVDDLLSCWRHSKKRHSLSQQSYTVLTTKSSPEDMADLYKRDMSLLPLMVHENATKYLQTMTCSEKSKVTCYHDVIDLLSASDVLEESMHASTSWPTPHLSGLLSVDLINSICSHLKTDGSFTPDKIRFTSSLSRTSLQSNTQKSIEAIIDKTQRPDVRLQDLLTVCQQIQTLSNCENHDRQIELLLQQYGLDKQDVAAIIKMYKL